MLLCSHYFFWDEDCLFGVRVVEGSPACAPAAPFISAVAGAMLDTLTPFLETFLG